MSYIRRIQPEELRRRLKRRCDLQQKIADKRVAEADREISFAIKRGSRGFDDVILEMDYQDFLPEW